MIYLIHGSDIVSSRSFLIKLKDQYLTISTIDLRKSRKDFELPDTSELFGEKKLVILENFVPDEQNKIIPKADYDLAFWVGEEVSVPSWVDKNLVFKISEQVNTFKLADLIVYGREKPALLALKKLLQTNTAPELLLGSFVRQFKLLSLSLNGETEKVSSSSFLKAKVKEQAENWSIRKIKRALLLLLKADLTLKRGELNSENVLTLLILDICRLAKI